jgi:hypothetical protein
MAGGIAGHPEEMMTVKNEMVTFMSNIVVKIANWPKVASMVKQSCEHLVITLEIGTVSSHLLHRISN